MTDTTMQEESGLAQGIEGGGVTVWKHQCATRRSLSYQLTQGKRKLSPLERAAGSESGMPRRPSFC